jgi:hypothetical protein
MKKIGISLQEFLETVSKDFIGLIGRVVMMKENLELLKGAANKSSNIL